MPRPKKRRKICEIPKDMEFRPAGAPGSEAGEGQDTGSTSRKNAIEMTLDEYETIRLIDLLGYSQGDCAAQMGVARTTVQVMYESARKKMAQMLAERRPLVIKGGNIIVCPRSEYCSGRKGNMYENCSYTKWL